MLDKNDKLTLVNVKLGTDRNLKKHNAMTQESLKDKGTGKAKKAKSGQNDVGTSPVVLSTVPAALADKVSPKLRRIKVTFDQEMADDSWSWTGGGDTYPETTGSPRYNKDRTKCSLPVKLEPGKVYWVGVNSPSYQNFKSAAGQPAMRYVILFATKDQNGEATPIPEELLDKAKAINARSQNASAKGMYTQEVVKEIDKDGLIHFRTTISQINQTDSELRTNSFGNSDFVHVTSMSDGEGRPLKFTERHESSHYRYKIIFNEAILPGEEIVYTLEGIETDMIRLVAGSEDSFEYSMTHWPGTNVATNRIETFVLPAGSEIIWTTQENMERRTKDGKIELHVEKIIPPGGSITTAFQYRLGDTENELKINPAPWVDGEQLELRLKSMVGMEIGTIIYTAEKIKNLWRVESYMAVPISNVQQFTLVDAKIDSFAPVAGRTKNQMGDFTAKYREDGVELTPVMGGNEAVRQVLLETTAYDNEQVLYLIRRLELKDGVTYSFPIFPVQGGAVVKCQIDVVAKETVTVSAGTFDCYKIMLAVYSGTTKALEHKILISADEKRYLVKYDSGAAIMELTKIGLKSNTATAVSSDKPKFTFEIPNGWHCYKGTGMGGYKLYWQLFSPEQKAWSVFICAANPLQGIQVREIAEGDIVSLKGFFKDYAVRDDSWREFEIDNIPAAQFVTDYDDSGKKMVEYRTYLLGQSSIYWFVFRTEKDQFDANRGQLDSVVNSFRK